MRYIAEDGGIVTVDGQVPSDPRWPDLVNTWPLTPGQPIIGERIDNRFIWFMRELPKLGECAPAPSPGGMMRDPITGALVPIPPGTGIPTVFTEGSVTGGTGSGGSEGNPAGGGGEM